MAKEEIKKLLDNSKKELESVLIEITKIISNK